MTGEEGDFTRLVRAAVWFDDHLDENQLPAYASVLAYARAHSDQRRECGEILLKTLRGQGFSDLFRYCMHTLRWPEIREALAVWREEAIKAEDRRAQFFLESLLRDWDGGRLT